MNKIIFFDIDTQFDFMMPSGRLYVPGAEKIIKSLASLTKAAQRHCIKIFSSVDWHTKADPEFKQFPAHCIKGTNGAKKISATLLKNRAIIKNKKYSPKSLLEKIKKASQIIFQKDTYTVFVNPNVRPLLRKVETAYVYGVALDYCVKACCLGLRKLGIKTYLVKDATKPVNKKQGKQTLKLLRKKGVGFISTRRLAGHP